MKLSDNPVRISFPRDDRSHLFFQSQPTAIRRGAAPVATLLLADDSMTTQKVVSLTFADEGIEVLTAADGDTAVKLYHERQPDIVLADVNIPGLNGYEICEEIRKTSDLATTPVVLLVGSFEPFDANEAHRVGANDYLTKPFSSIRRLVATVLAFLDDQPATEESASQVDGQVQEISVEPQPEEMVETLPDESVMPTAEYDSSELVETDGQTDEVAQAPEPEAVPETARELVPESAEPVAVAEEPNFHSTTDIEDLYSESFAATVEMPHTIAERARFSDVSSDDGLIEAQFTGPAAEEQTHEPVQQVDEEQVSEPSELVADEPVSFEAAAEAESAEAAPETTFEVQPPIEADTAEESTQSTNGYAPWAEPAIAADQPPVTFEESPHDAPTERLTPQNAPTDEYNFEFRGEEAFFEPTAEPVGNTSEAPPTEDLSADQNDLHLGSESSDAPPGNFPETTHVSTPWETVASSTDGEIKFDDRNVLEIPGQADRIDERADAQAAQGLSMETVEHIARIVASQMSEQIIREIAERVVPMVVQQTLANKRDESNN